MREVKFRVRQDGEIVAYERLVGDPITGMSHWIHVESTIDWGVYYPGVYPGEGIREQYTGLKDSVDEEVYEGDIIEIDDTETDDGVDTGVGALNAGVKRNIKHTAPVVFEGGAFGIHIAFEGDNFAKGFCPLHDLDDDNVPITIICDIHEGELAK